MLVVVGAPLMFLEMGLGQFCPLPVGNLFKAINVIYDGVGKAMLFVAFWRMLWNAERVVHSLYLAALSVPSIVTHESPWTKCNATEGLKSEKCFDYLKYQSSCNLTDGSVNIAEGVCGQYHNAMISNINDPTTRLTPMFLDYVKTQIFPSAFRLKDITIGPPFILLVLIFAWILFFAFAFVGVRRAAPALITFKLMGFVALITFAIMSFTARHAKNGHRLFLEFNSEHLLDGSTWSDAVKHVIFSLSLCDGTVHKLGSLSHFNTCYYQSIIGTLVFSFLLSTGSAVMFYSSMAAVTHTMYEHISKEQDRFRMQEFMGHGKILMFTSFPEYVISVGGDWMYAIIMIFYLSLAFITVLSVVMNMNKLITVYEWSNLYRFLWRYRPGHSVRKHFVISSIIASLLLLCMIIIVQPWGQVVKQILKYEIASLLFVIGLAEILMIGYAYDAHRFIVDIDSMHKGIWCTTAGFYAFCYFFASPFLMTAGCVYHFTFGKNVRVMDYIVTDQTMLVSNIVMCVGIAPIVFHLGKRLIEKFYRNLSFRAIFKLTPYWIPPNKQDADSARSGRLAFRTQTIYTKTKIDGDATIFKCRKKDRQQEEKNK